MLGSDGDAAEPAATDTLADALVAPANCALATVINAASHLPDPCRAVVIQGAGLLGIYACALLRERGVRIVSFADWQVIDRLEIEAAPDGAPRLKFVTPAEMIAALDTAQTA